MGLLTAHRDAPVTAEAIGTDIGYNSPSLAADPTNARFVVAADRIDAPGFGCGLQLSGDGGQSWVDGPIPRLPQGADTCYAPSVAFDRHGRLFYLFVGLHTLGNTPMGAFLAFSTDRGRHFSAPVRVLGPDAFGVSMVLDPTLGPKGRIDVVYIQASGDPVGTGFPTGPNPVLARHSDDEGRTFSPAVRVSDDERHLVTAPTVAIGRDHQVHVAYYDLGADSRDYQGLEGPTYDGTWSLVVATSADGGAYFQPGVVAEPAVVPPERVQLVLTMPAPALAADAQGNVYLSWYDDRNGDWDVFLHRSGDGGHSWSAPRRVNDDPLGDGKTQYLPALSVAPDGRLNVVYYDRRNDPDDHRNDVSLSTSTDQGNTFSPSLRLNRESFDGRIGRRYLTPYNADGQLVEFGGRLGLVSADDHVTAAWADTRMAYLAFSDTPGLGESDQSIYAARADVARP